MIIMKATSEILHLLKNGGCTHDLTDSLVKLCTKTALSILSNSYKYELSRLSFLSITLSDLAVDSITPLFIKDKSGELPIRIALLNWNKEITDDASAYYFLNKIISNRIEQEIAKKLKEADPFFGKILRSINHLVDTNRIKKTTWFGIAYLIEPETESIKQKPIESEVLESFPSALFQGTNLNVITALFKYLKNETDFFPAIPLNALIRKIKHVNGSFLQQVNYSSVQESIEEKINVEKITASSLIRIHEHLDKFYLSKGKFNGKETAIFKSVLAELANDLKDGGISRGLYEYLFPHMNDLSKQDFYKKYHQPMDYLLRLLRKEIAARLDDSAG